MPTKVQIVDENLLFAEALGSVIRDLPAYELVGIAVTGAQALSMARESRPDVVIVDHRLPGYGTDTLGPRLRSIVPDVRFVVLIADETERSQVRGLPAGAVSYLTKGRALDDVAGSLAALTAASPSQPLGPTAPR